MNKFIVFLIGLIKYAFLIGSLWLYGVIIYEVPYIHHSLVTFLDKGEIRYIYMFFLSPTILFLLLGLFIFFHKLHNKYKNFL
jgi:hypothetical protein